MVTLKNSRRAVLRGYFNFTNQQTASGGEFGQSLG
jgi:hypothetical protein